MPKPKDPPPLVVAASALEEALAHFSRLAVEAKGESLDSARSLQRCTQALTESVEQKTRIEEKLGALVAEIDASRQRQEEAIRALLEATRELEQRAKSRNGLLARFAELGEAAKRVNALTQEIDLRDEARDREKEVLERLATLRVEMSAVAAEATALFEAAKAERWPEIARQADSVRQEVQSAANKVALAYRAIASKAPS